MLVRSAPTPQTDMQSLPSTQVNLSRSIWVLVRHIYLILTLIQEIASESIHLAFTLSMDQSTANSKIMANINMDHNKVGDMVAMVLQSMTMANLDMHLLRPAELIVRILAL